MAAGGIPYRRPTSKGARAASTMQAGVLAFEVNPPVKITVSVKDSDGAIATGTVMAYSSEPLSVSPITGPVLPPVPVVSATTFVVPPNPTNDELVGHLSVTNLPLTSLNIVSGDPTGLFAAYPATQNLRTVATGPVPGPATYNLGLEAINAAGPGVPSTITVVVQGAVPVISNGNFSIPLPLTTGQTIGTMSATNNPTSWAITSGDPGGAPPNNEYAININTGAITVTANGTGQGAGVVTLVITATNAAGTSAPGSATITLTSLAITNGQQISSSNTGRAGAAAASISGYSSSLTTVSGNQSFSGTQTFNNVNFTGQVTVTGGNVTFNFCFFSAQPVAQACALNQTGGTITVNWSDFDTGLRTTQGVTESRGFGANIGIGGFVTTGTFTVYRCHIQGFGNGMSFFGWCANPSFVTECCIENLTSGGGTHVDGIEYYSSNNVTIQRCRIDLDNAGTGPVNITNDFGDTPNDNPIIIQNNYIQFGLSMIACLNNNTTTKKRGVQYFGNYFGDNTAFGYLMNLGGNGSTQLNITYNQAYWNANQATNTPGIVYWDASNVWAPNGEGVTFTGPPPALSRGGAGNPTCGMPHVPGQFIDLAKVWPDGTQLIGYGLSPFTWNGQLLGTGGGGVPVVTNSTFGLNTSPAPTVGENVGTMSATNSPTSWVILSGDPSGNFTINTSTGMITVTSAGAANLNNQNGTEVITVQATNGSGSGSGTATINYTASVDAYSSVDGFLNASTAAIQLPTILNTYHAAGHPDQRVYGAAGPSNYAFQNPNYYQPPWYVAGVDYAVGIHSGVVLHSPTTLSVTGITVNGNIVNFGQSATVPNGTVISGIDFTGYQCNFSSNLSTITFNDCNFATTSPNLNALIILLSNSAVQTLNFNYCNFNSNNLQNNTTYNGQFYLGQNTSLNLTYCYVQNADEDIIDAGINVTCQYNLFTRTLGPNVGGVHADLYQPSTTMNMTANFSFNTYYIIAGGTQGLGFFSGNPGNFSFSSITCNNNIFIAKNATMNYMNFVLYSGTKTGGGTGGPNSGAPLSFQYNYADPSGSGANGGGSGIGFYQTQGTLPSGATLTYGGNYNMLTGTTIAANT